MPNTTYSIPINDPDRIAEAMCQVFLHLRSWKRDYNINFVSAVRSGNNLDVTFSDPVPLVERQHIRLSTEG